LHFLLFETAKNDAVPAYEPWNVERAKALIAEHVGLEGPLIPILHALNDRFGHINNEAIKIVADVLNLTRAEVQGVVGFYHDFRREPAGRHVIQVCRAEACQSMGCEELAERLERALGIKFGETSPDRRVTLLPVYCLGNCSLSPAVMVDGELYGRMDERKVLSLVQAP